jgi:hypothetical protein
MNTILNNYIGVPSDVDGYFDKESEYCSDWGQGEGMAQGSSKGELDEIVYDDCHVASFTNCTMLSYDEDNFAFPGCGKAVGCGDEFESGPYFDSFEFDQ